MDAFHDCEDMKSWVILMHISDSECNNNDRVVNMKWPPANWDNDWERSLCSAVETSKYASMETASHGSSEKSEHDANRIVFRLTCRSHVLSDSCLFAFLYPDSGGFHFSFLKKQTNKTSFIMTSQVCCTF